MLNMLVVDFSKLSFESYIQCSVFIIVLLVLVFKGERQNWLTVDIISTIGFGLVWIFIPNYFLGVQVINYGATVETP